MTTTQERSSPATAPAYTMKLEKDVEIRMRDGELLLCNVYRPDAEGRFPVLITLGPYGKDVHLKEFQPATWQSLQEQYPEVLEASSCEHLGWENPDPEVWVPHGYVVVKVDSRGAGKSPGLLDVNSPSEFRDFYDAVEWAGVQPWSNGKVGLLGISYYACGQWMVAALRPPHLAAILPWQGTCDFYRDRTRHGGIFSSGFVMRWWNRSVLQNQYGRHDENAFHDYMSGGFSPGGEDLMPEQLAENRIDYIESILAHPLLDDWYAQRSGDLSKIDVPALVVANWGGLALHLRGTITGFSGIASREKWLKVQSGSYFATFFMPESVAMQRRFFDRYLKEIDNGWESEPRVDVAVRAHDDTIKRHVFSDEWPVSGTRWTRMYLDASNQSLNWRNPDKEAAITYPAISEGVTFLSDPLDRELEFAGPVKARLYVSSSLEDMDLFATLTAWDQDGKEVTFYTSTEPRAPVSQGWLRVTQRKLDPVRSTEFQPVHSHDERQPLTPGEVYEIDIEIWPCSAALPAGYRIGLTLQGKDYEREGITGAGSGSGNFTHNHPQDRPPERYSGDHTIHTGGVREAYLLLPVLPV